MEAVVALSPASSGVAQRRIRAIDERLRKEREVSELARLTAEGRARQAAASAMSTTSTSTAAAELRPPPPPTPPTAADGAVRMQWTQTKTDAVLRIFVPRAFVDAAQATASPRAKMVCTITRRRLAVQVYYFKSMMTGLFT